MKIWTGAAMSEITRHYDELLAEHYSWMVGVPFEEKVAEQRALLEGLGLCAGSHGTAIDLGCGPGYQSAALFDLGFERVIAIDTSAALIEELKAQQGVRAIEPVLGDMRGFAEWVAPGGADAIVCMGDTLTHLETRADLSRLLADALSALAPGGVLVLTFRDFSQELIGLDRFIAVRGDRERVMTCFLEYEPETVVVHDLVHVREDAGWKLAKSRYRKLRLPPNEVVARLRDVGFEIQADSAAGRMWAIKARKPRE